MDTCCLCISVLDINHSQTWYINGVKDNAATIGLAVSEQSGKSEICAPVHFGAKNDPGEYATNVGLDEIKYIYRSLSDEGLCKCLI